MAGDDRPGAIGGVSSEDAAANRSRRGRPVRRIRVMAAVAVVVIVADQVTKSLAVARLVVRADPPDRAVLARALVQLRCRVQHRYRSLTLPTGALAVVLVAGVAWFGRTVPNTAAAVAVGMILGGALGNLSDRIFRGHHGAVVDFIYSGFWPTFNVADSSIVCGSILLCIVLWRSSATRHPPEPGRA